MFREMRRQKQQLAHAEAEKLLLQSTSGVLALLGDDDYPYAVPLSHCYVPPYLYFHGAIEGHKIDAVRRHGKASFCVVTQDEVVPQTFSTNYRSAIAFGSIRIVEDTAEKRAAMEALAERFAPGRHAAAQKETEESWNHMHVLAMKIEHLTGKESKALMQQRSKQP